MYTILYVFNTRDNTRGFVLIGRLGMAFYSYRGMVPVVTQHSPVQGMQHYSIPSNFGRSRVYRPIAMNLRTYLLFRNS